MVKSLVIVESPTKARTIARFLGRGYTVKASMGHVRDLPERKLGVDVENDFAPGYVIPKDKLALLKELREAAKDVSLVYLATDPDREGEAIAWHLSQALELDGKPIKRVVFHEITETAIDEAFRHPREVDGDLVNAQQARRLLDRIVGYRLSPLLWKKVRRGLSAGRVQSAALHMLVARENEIQAFVPVEYWRILAQLAKPVTNGQQERAAFTAALTSVMRSKGKLAVGSKDEAEGILRDLDGATYVVAKVQRKETQRKPAPPFTTSSLQQEAWRKLRFPARRTMVIAQQLYEGIALGSEGAEGLITYMRTDSPTVSAAAIQETRMLIKERFGPAALPAHHRVYVAKSKGAQEAHEAIRPTSAHRDPAAIKPHLSAEQARLYDLIWKRMVASQMHNALFDATTVDIEAAAPHASRRFVFQAKGLVQKDPGFLLLYSEGQDTDAEEDAGALPPLADGEVLDLLKLDSQQKFTQPPPRYTEGSLVKALEENGIGRPSTYAPTISTILDRGYVQKDGGTLMPQQLGVIVTELLRQSYPEVLDAGFTARMEDELDEIARGERPWVPFLAEFYGPFDQAVQKATAEAPRMEEQAGESCATCGKPMVIKQGRFGLFVACSGYPECRNTHPHQVKQAVQKATAEAPRMEEQAGEPCEACGKPMVIKQGRFGPFVACSGFPACRTKRPILVKVGVACPTDGGDLVEKRSRKGKLFFSCANYPKCTFATGRRPVAQPCPTCGGLLTAFSDGGVACIKGDYRGRLPREAKEEGEPEPDAVPAGEPEAVAAG